MSQPRPSPSGSRGSHAARRAQKRRGRGWRIAGTVALALIVSAGVAYVAATRFLYDDADEAAASSHVSLGNKVAQPATQVTPTTIGLPECRAPLTADAPLRLWIAGDSIAYSIGNGLGKKAANTGVVAPVYESRVSSGISTPTFFDWPKRAGEELPRLNPEIVVFVMGTNDWMAPQPTPVDASGQPTWKAKYEAQVQVMVDALTQGGRTLYWVGPPILRDTKQDAAAQQAAAVIKTVVQRNPSAVFFDAHALLDADDGTYTSALDVDGKRVVVRAGDGIHLTPDGGDYVGAALFDAIDEQCDLRDQAVPGSKQVVVETKGSTSVAPGSTATAPSVTVAPTTPATSPPVTTPATTTRPATTPTTTALPAPTTSTTSK